MPVPRWNRVASRSGARRVAIGSQGTGCSRKRTRLGDGRSTTDPLQGAVVNRTHPADLTSTHPATAPAEVKDGI